MKKIFFIFITLFLILSARDAFAVTIVDTGTPGGSYGQGVIDEGGSYQLVTAEFSINNPGYSVTDISGYFFNVLNYPGNIHIEINGDGGNIPDTTTYFSGAANVTGEGWFGVHGLTGLNLYPGTYWVTFKPDSGTRVGMRVGAPNGLINEAGYYHSPTGTPYWYDADSINVGVRILGNAMTPEPASLSLLGLGLLGLFGFKKRVH